MRLVPVGALKEGTLVAKTIYNEGSQVLLRSGVALTKSLIEKLKDNGIYSIYILDDYSLSEIADVVSPELRNRAIKDIKSVFEVTHEALRQQIKGLEREHGHIKKRLAALTDNKYFDSLQGIVDDMLDEIGSNREAMIGLVDIKNTNNFIYQHCVQVTVLSLLVGISLKMQKQQLKDLAIGAMIHDIGLSLIEDDLIFYRDDFTAVQKQRYEQHCSLGYEYMKENSNLSASARICILQHHERYDGLGYPSGVVGDHIHLNARIVGLANTYDKLTSGVNGEAVAPNEAIEYIMGNSGTGRRFDIELAKLFVRRIIPFPEGSYVQLSNGQQGVVIGFNASHPLRPIVKIIERGKRFEDLKICDLIDHETYNITIEKIVHELSV